MLPASLARSGSFLKFPPELLPPRLLSSRVRFEPLFPLEARPPFEFDLPLGIFLSPPFFTLILNVYLLPQDNQLTWLP